MQTFYHFELETKKQFELVNVTALLTSAVTSSGLVSGIGVVFSPHTTASIRLTHDEPLLMQDIMKALNRIVPQDVSYGHDLFEVRQHVAVNERSNGHAHVESFLLGGSESLIIDQGKLVLGEKQSVFFVELDGGRDRDFYFKISGN